MDAVLILVLVLVLSFLAVKRKAFVDRVNILPGPKGNAVVGNLIEIAKHKFEILSFAAVYSEQYKNVGLFRVWMLSFPYVVLNSAEYVEAVLSSVQHIEKSNDYSSLHPWLGFGLLTSTGAKWHARRRLLTPTFHFKILEEFLPVFNRNTNALVRALASKDDGGGHFDVSHFVHLSTLDTICESAMGTSVGALDNANSEYVAAVKTACSAAYMRLVQPWIYPNVTFYSSPIGWAFRRALKVLHGQTRSVIKQRKQEMMSPCTADEEDGVKKKMVFLDQLLQANQKGAGLSDTDIQEEVDTFMFEGHDTTGTAISFALYLLSKDQGVQAQLYEEVLNVLGTEDRDVTIQDLSEVKYLERVIKETLRLYPSVPVVLRALNADLKVSGKGGDYVIPAGVVLSISPYLLHRVESLWPDPERFDPDRFLPENSSGRHPFAYVPFSAGPRNCIGQKFALMEMKCVLAKLVLKYRFLEAYPGYTARVVGEIILKCRDKGPLVRIERRK